MRKGSDRNAIHFIGHVRGTREAKNYFDWKRKIYQRASSKEGWRDCSMSTKDSCTMVFIRDSLLMQSMFSSSECNSSYAILQVCQMRIRRKVSQVHALHTARARRKRLVTALVFFSCNHSDMLSSEGRGRSGTKSRWHANFLTNRPSRFTCADSLHAAHLSWE
jgi:hypothetical protein